VLPSKLDVREAASKVFDFPFASCTTATELPARLVLWGRKFRFPTASTYADFTKHHQEYNWNTTPPLVSG
jgi:hypothetical protein